MDFDELARHVAEQEKKGRGWATLKIEDAKELIAGYRKPEEPPASAYPFHFPESIP